MSRYLSLSLGLISLVMFFPLAHAADAPAPASTASAPASPHDLAYSLGASLGERLRQEEPNLQVQALLDGLRQAYQGESLAIKKDRIEQILTDHDAQAEAQAESSEAGNTESQTEAAMSAEHRFLATEKSKAGVRELADGILVTEQIHGSGVLPATTGKVQVRYVGRLPDGSVFDQSDQPQWFSLDSVIAGWRTALQQMPVGSKWRIVVPSDQAYGAEGASDLIAPFTPLVFDLELLGTAQ